MSNYLLFCQFKWVKEITNVYKETYLPPIALFNFSRSLLMYVWLTKKKISEQNRNKGSMEWLYLLTIAAIACI